MTSSSEIPRREIEMLVLRSYPHALQIVEILAAIPSAAYPLADRAQFLTAVGEAANVSVFGQTRRIRDLLRLVSDDYFPIESPTDLAAKAARLDVVLDRVRGASPAARLTRLPAGAERPTAETLKRVQGEHR